MTCNCDHACDDSDKSGGRQAACRARREREMRVSVVLPVYNEALVLPVLLARVAQVLERCRCQYEIIFVNDGSSDDSPRVLDQLAATNLCVRVLHLARNFGHQAAVHAGLSAADGDAIVLMDSDMQDDPEAIVDFLRQWRSGYDVVYALRTQRKESLAKRIAFTAFHRLMAAVANVPIPADAGIFGLVDRRAAQEILALGERDRYFPGLRAWVGFRQIGVPVERKARYDDHPRVSLRGLLRLAKTAILAFSTFPLTAFYGVAALAALASATTLAYAVGHCWMGGVAAPGWLWPCFGASTVIALNAIGIGVLGEYVARIYDQVRGRPMFIVDRAVNCGERVADGNRFQREVMDARASHARGASVPMNEPDVMRDSGGTRDSDDALAAADDLYGGIVSEVRELTATARRAAAAAPASAANAGLSSPVAAGSPPSAPLPAARLDVSPWTLEEEPFVCGHTEG